MAAQGMLFPLEIIQPSVILSKYSEWIYFALLVVFFIALAGIGLRKFFDHPYVKPLIVAVGLLLAFTVFKNRAALTMVFNGWGSLGTILLVCIVAVIPFGLARGFGLASSRAFWLTYGLMYVISWVNFPSFYYYLGEHNFGFLNLALLIMFFVSLYQMFKFKLSGLSASKDMIKDIPKNSPQKREVTREAGNERAEEQVVEKEEIRLTEREYQSLADISASLNEIQKIVGQRGNGLSRQDREPIAKHLGKILGNENILKQDLVRLKTLFARLRILDSQQLTEKLQRLKQVAGGEKDILQKEIAHEKEKITLGKMVADLEARMEQDVKLFEQEMKNSVEVLAKSMAPTAALVPLRQAQKILGDMVVVVKGMRDLEQKILQLVKVEEQLLGKENSVT